MLCKPVITLTKKVLFLTPLLTLFVLWSLDIHAENNLNIQKLGALNTSDFAHIPLISQGGVIDVNKLDAVLGDMGLNLTEEEIKDLKRNLPTGGEH